MPMSRIQAVSNLLELDNWRRVAMGTTYADVSYEPFRRMQEETVRPFLRRTQRSLGRPPESFPRMRPDRAKI